MCGLHLYIDVIIILCHLIHFCLCRKALDSHRRVGKATSDKLNGPGERYPAPDSLVEARLGDYSGRVGEARLGDYSESPGVARLGVQSDNPGVARLAD